MNNIAETLKYFGATTFYRAKFSISQDHVDDDQFEKLIDLRDDSLFDINPQQDLEAAHIVLENLEKARKTFVRENTSLNKIEAS